MWFFNVAQRCRWRSFRVGATGSNKNAVNVYKAKQSVLFFVYRRSCRRDDNTLTKKKKQPLPFLSVRL